MIDAHMVDFEKEAVFKKALAVCCQAHSTFKAKTLKDALHVACPDFAEGLFAIRPCFRKLKFVGSESCHSNDSDNFFKQGETYYSVDFNGGSYGIKGYDARIGCGYFEVCND